MVRFLHKLHFDGDQLLHWSVLLVLLYHLVPFAYRHWRPYGKEKDYCKQGRKPSIFWQRSQVIQLSSTYKQMFKKNIVRVICHHTALL